MIRGIGIGLLLLSVCAGTPELLAFPGNNLALEADEDTPKEKDSKPETKPEGLPAAKSSQPEKKADKSPSLELNPIANAPLAQPVPPGPWTTPALPPLPPPLMAPPGPCLNARVEYLLWGTKADHLPVLASTGSLLLGPGGAPFGPLGVPGPQPLLGGTNLNRDLQSGFRLTVGAMTPDGYFEGSGFALFEGRVRSAISSLQNPVIVRPFYDIAFGRPSAQVTAFPGLSQGALTLTAPADLWGFEVNYKCDLCAGLLGPGCLRLLLGVRYLNLKEDLTLTEGSLASTAGVPVLGYQFRAVQDQFQTWNRFFGFQAGLEMEQRWGQWSLAARTKLALGVNTMETDIEGSTGVLAPTGPGGFVGGLLALPSNIGKDLRGRFAVVPEVGLDVGYQLTSQWRALVGYNFLYLSDAIRPGQKIDTTLDSTQIPQFLPPGTPIPVTATATRPAGLIRPDTDFWAQGLTLGLEFRY